VAEYSAAWAFPVGAQAASKESANLDIRVPLLRRFAYLKSDRSAARFLLGAPGPQVRSPPPTKDHRAYLDKNKLWHYQSIPYCNGKSAIRYRDSTEAAAAAFAP
jgi:hypothetical protein